MKQHALDPVSLVFGTLFALLGGFLVISDARWESANGAWVIPAILVVMGGAIIWSTVSRMRSEEVAEEVDPSDVAEEYSIPAIDEL